MVLTDRTLDLVAEGFDFGLRGSAALPDSSLVARKLTSLEVLLVASPEYAKTRGLPDTPAELGSHDLALMGMQNGRGKLTLHRADGSRELVELNAISSLTAVGTDLYFVANPGTGAKVYRLDTTLAAPASSATGGEPRPAPGGRGTVPGPPRHRTRAPRAAGPPHGATQ